MDFGLGLGTMEMRSLQRIYRQGSAGPNSYREQRSFRNLRHNGLIVPDVSPSSSKSFARFVLTDFGRQVLADIGDQKPVSKHRSSKPGEHNV